MSILCEGFLFYLILNSTHIYVQSAIPTHNCLCWSKMYYGDWLPLSTPAGGDYPGCAHVKARLQKGLATLNWKCTDELKGTGYTMRPVPPAHKALDGERTRRAICVLAEELYPLQFLLLAVQNHGGTFAVYCYSVELSFHWPLRPQK